MTGSDISAVVRELCDKLYSIEAAALKSTNRPIARLVVMADGSGSIVLSHGYSSHPDDTLYEEDFEGYDVEKAVARLLEVYG